MIDLPSTLQTRADFDRAIAMAKAGECRPSEVAPYFTGLLASRWAYEFDRVLAVAELPDGELPEYLVTAAAAENEDDPVRAQSKRTEQVGAKIFQLGYTVAEVKQIITELESL